MNQTVVADFLTKVVPDTGRYDEPVRGRVLMNREQLVIVTADDRTAVDIDAIFDVAYGSAPPDLKAFFEDTVTVAHRTGGQARVAVIEGADETVERFATLLFKAVLNETTVLVRHPAKVGGRVTDASFQRATLFVSPSAVRFRSPDPLTVDVSTVSFFEREDREVAGETRPVLSVRHASDEAVVTSEVAIAPERKMNVLGRFLRIEYSKLKDRLSGITLKDDEVAVLVGLYSGASEGNLAGMLGVDATRVSALRNSLLGKSMLEDTPDGLVLTSIGKLAVGEHIETVNV